MFATCLGQVTTNLLHIKETMKKTTLILTFALASIISFTGCHKKPVGVTDIPGMRGPGATGPGGLDNGGRLEPPRIAADTTEGLSQVGTDTGPYAGTFANGEPNREKFAADTVHFETDSAVIKKGDLAKLDEVANYFKSNQSKEALQIEGNADERGTEQYNLSLGDKRALAVREHLAAAGVDSQRMKTVSYGKAKPVDPERTAAAYAKNRRVEMVLLVPKQ
jgi:outer membrane protein OmpA-like peptidoglycan-associated protein